MESQYALSLKQPWATLLAHGRKTIEVRRWSTPRRGRVFIHAARVSDPRPEVWARMPEELRESALQVGGIIGAGDLVHCIEYRDPESFAADCPKHWNDAAWFEAPVLCGFVFEKLQVLPFRRYPGWVRFFRVDLQPPTRSFRTKTRKNPQLPSTQPARNA